MRIALVGAGGSGKTTLAAALGHALARRFPGGIHWFRIGAWDARTLGEMLAIRFGTTLDRAAMRRALLAELSRRGDALIVLDNHENDGATATLLDSLAGAPVTWIVTARRCLLAGVSIFPVVAPLVTSGRPPFPRVAQLTRLLRWNPLALDLADALVAARNATVERLATWLAARGIDRVAPIAHEDDLPEVKLLVDFSWRTLSRPARAILGVLAHVGGDHVDRASLLALARVRKGGDRALESLRALRLVQEPFEDRFTLHAVVRHAVAPRTRGADPRRYFRHYVQLLERDPSRLDLEQTHLFAAMDWAHAGGDLGDALAVEKLFSRLGFDAM